MQAARIKELITGKEHSAKCPNLITIHTNMTDRKVFFVHAGNGEISNYFDLCQLLNKNMSFYGLRYITNGIAPNNVTIKELANLYLQQIRTVQPKGPYHLIGWCIGGTIAFEMARQLEEAGEQTTSLTLINSISPRFWPDITPFTRESEHKFISKLLPKQEKYTFASTENIQELWQTTIKYLSTVNNIEQIIRDNIPNEVAVSIPNFYNSDMNALIKYINIIRTLHVARVYYKPANALVNSKLSFIEVSANDVISDKNANLADWQCFCSHPIDRLQIPGNHYSIFTAPHVEKLAHTLNFLLESE
jgi:thioesterase domain-containing protein